MFLLVMLLMILLKILSARRSSFSRTETEVFKVVLAIVEPGTVDIDKLTLELAIATFISRMDGWVGKEQGHPVL